jgi:hypothetical protein
MRKAFVELPNLRAIFRSATKHRYRRNDLVDFSPSFPYGSFEWHNIVVTEASDRPDSCDVVREKIHAGLPKLNRNLKGANLYLDMADLPLDQPDRI